MDKEIFFKRFRTLLDKLKNEYDLESEHDALILWFGENYISLDPIDVKTRIVSDKRAEGVDAILLDQMNFDLYFIQAKTVSQLDKTENNYPESDLKLTLEGIRYLLTGDYTGKITPRLENLIDEYHEYDKTGNFNTIILFLCMKKNPSDFKFIESFEKEFPSISINFFNFDWIFNFYTDKYLALIEPPPENISFEVKTNYHYKDTPYKSRVFTTKAKEVAKIYNDYKERIFQQNVRYSLGLKSKSINKQIQETAVDQERRNHFWYFNNGITIICTELGETTSKKVINLKNAQIINGAQSTYALYDAFKDGNLGDEVEILIKAIECDDKDFMESVTLYTNSQNAIRLRDLCSNDKIQIEIQTIIRDIFSNFYERKRGEFNSLYPTPDARKKSFGDDYNLRIVSNENAAQALLAMFLDKPSQSKAEKRRIFMKDEGFYDGIFDRKEKLLSEKLFLSWKLKEYIEMKKKLYEKVYAKAEDLKEKYRDKVYRYDFLLYSEYFILNIFKDFIKENKFDIDSKRDEILEVIKKVENNDSLIQAIYDDIKKTMKDYISTIKDEPRYYHNKFFKNEKSIGLIRAFFNEKFKFVEFV